MAESKRAGVPLYFAGSVCPKETYPPADPLQFCSTAFGAHARLSGRACVHRQECQGTLRLGLAAMAIPISRGEIDYAEGLAKKLGMTAVDKAITPPPTPDYTPFATRLKDANPNWMWAWSPWFSQVRTYEAMRRIGWQGRYLTWAHLNAEEELARIKDPDFYVIGTNAFFEDNLPIQAEIRAVAHRGNVKYPVTYLTEGFIVGLVLETALKNTAWPPTPAKVAAAMGTLKVDLKGLRGGPLEWTKDNHFRTRQYYRVWRWDTQKNAIVRVQDWQAIDVKRQQVQLAVNIVVLASIYALISCGYVLIYRVSRVLSLAQGELMLLGAFGLFTTASLFSGSPLLADRHGRSPGCRHRRPCLCAADAAHDWRDRCSPRCSSPSRSGSSCAG